MLILIGMQNKIMQMTKKQDFQHETTILPNLGN